MSLPDGYECDLFDTPDGRRLNVDRDPRRKFLYAIMAREGKKHRSKDYRHFVILFRTNSLGELKGKLEEMRAIKANYPSHWPLRLE